MQGESVIVPRGPIGELVVGQHVGPGLGLAQMFENYDRDLRKAEELGCFIPTVAGDDLPVLVDQDRCIESECLDAPGYRSDLLARMLAFF